MKELYNSDLANELGNCISRITTLAATDGLTAEKISYKMSEEQAKMIESFHLNEVLILIWEEIKKLNKHINEETPWSRSPSDRHDFLLKSLAKLQIIGNNLYPFLPTASTIIISGTTGAIKKVPPLFPRLLK